MLSKRLLAQNARPSYIIKITFTFTLIRKAHFSSSIHDKVSCYKKNNILTAHFTIIYNQRYKNYLYISFKLKLYNIKLFIRSKTYATERIAANSRVIIITHLNALNAIRLKRCKKKYYKRATFAVTKDRVTNAGATLVRAWSSILLGVSFIPGTRAPSGDASAKG